MSDDGNTIRTITDSPVAPSTGGLLRAARERAGMAVEDIASKLKLSARQVHAIENEHWDALPEAPFTRGFVRSYARLVGVDPESLRLNVARPLTDTALAPTPVGIGEVTRDSDGNQRAWSAWLIPAVLVALLAAGVAWFLWRGTPMPMSANKLPVEAVKQQANSAAASAAAASKESTPGVLLVPASPAAGATEPSAAAPAAVAAPATGALLAGATPPPANAAAATATAPTAPAAAATAAGAIPTPNAPSAELGKKRIVMNFTGRSWTEVRSKGELVFTETVSNGSREVSAVPPLSFVIGNASNVVITIDGKPYNFSDSIRNEVARFRIE
ncbi:MAG: helix-turn-helix domain-containing protein [Betaproteobacteria bacterium]|nr:MAG: helix-turn-helix domain-containing protein [Betaproteobacteria bacterium]